MKFPLVTRGRYERLLKRYRKVKSEKEELLGMLGVTPMEPLTKDTDLSRVQPIRGRPTIASLTSEANKAAWERAKQGPGAMPVSQEMEELALAAFKGRRDAKRSAVGN